MRRLAVAVAAVLVGFAVAPCIADDQPDAGPIGAVAAQDDPAAKAALAEQIMAEAEQRSGREWDPRARANLKTVLLGYSVKDLSEAAAAERGLEKIVGEPKIIGSNVNEWVFTPVPSCRALDTRPGSGQQGDGDGPLAPGTPYDFFVSGFCGIPFPNAKAVSINFIAVSAAGNGNLRTWPWDSSLPAQPATAISTYTFGFSTSNAAVIPICNQATSTGGTCAGGDLFVQTNNSSSHVVADLFGYFSPATGLGTSSEGSGSFVNLSGGACANVTSVSLTNSTSNPRGVVCHSKAVAQLDHTTGTEDTIDTFITTTNGTTCSVVETGPGHATAEIPAAIPTLLCCQDFTMNSMRRFVLAAGATGTYFFNAVATGSVSGNDRVEGGSSLVCSFQ